MTSRIVSEADFERVRYALCWEDADVLVEALPPAPGAVCVSIASAGDNALALLAGGPARVIALDLNPAQLACLTLRVAAYRRLQHGELLELIGARPSERRGALYEACRTDLDAAGRTYWDGRPDSIRAGIGSVGKFERYFATFRRRVLPCVHRRRMVDRLFEPKTWEERHRFYDRRWNTWRWRLLFRLFFSRTVMGRLGRDPAFFQYVQGAVAPRILERAHYAMTELEPAANPYLHWILRGTFGEALPFALREEHFEAIRRHLDRLEWRLASIEDFLAEAPRVDAWNLSDIFEYMPVADYHELLERIVAASNPGARIAYWNMLARRRRPDSMADRLRSLDALAASLHARDKAFFYRAFVVEEVLA